MKRLYHLQDVLSIPEEEMEQIKRQAQEGDPAACYELARIHLLLHDCEDYLESAHELLLKAQKGGIADAEAVIAAMMFRGEIEPYDPHGAAKMLENALQDNSEYAAYFQLANLIYGRFGVRQDVELALSTLDSLIATSDNPYWYSLKGDALFHIGRIEESAAWFEKAVEGGVISACGDLALARGMNDNGEFTDRDTYLEALVEGDGMGDPMCMYYMVLERMFEYDDIDPEDTETCDNYRELIIQALEICAEQCLPASFSLLGDIFHEGRLGIPADPVKAWEYYVKGSEFMHESCFEKMYDMLHDGEIEPGRMNREDAMDLCAVNGARLHNRKLLVAAVEAYRRGRLTQFAREMEMYHIPAYDTWA
ncbi:MAG: sel1 repeat family protein [Bacteroidales bacterium]|nr:sel1 repeat family protein [Bacteroidales bacterium]